MNKPLQKLVVSKEPTNAKILTAKCECCGDEKEYTRRNWPPDWSQTGTSKYGNAYLKSKIGWWCDKPACFDASRTLNEKS